MAYFDSARPTLFATGPSRVARRLVDALRAWQEARLTRRALSPLSDRELADIGLQRSDLDNLSRAGFRHY